MHHRDISAFPAENPAIQHGGMLCFDLIPQDSARYATGFAVVKIASTHLRAMAELPYFLAASEAAAARCQADAQGRPVLLMILRPWGSASFHGGQLRLEEPAERLVELVLALRPDGRDAALMAAFSARFAALDAGPATDLTGLWPSRLSMDPFLDNFAAIAAGLPMEITGPDPLLFCARQV